MIELRDGVPVIQAAPLDLRGERSAGGSRTRRRVRGGIAGAVNASIGRNKHGLVGTGRELDGVHIRMRELRRAGRELPESGNSPVPSSIVGPEHVDAAHPNHIRIQRVHGDRIIVVALIGKTSRAVRAHIRKCALRIGQKDRVQAAGILIRNLRVPGTRVSIGVRTVHSQQRAQVVAGLGVGRDGVHNALIRRRQRQ